MKKIIITILLSTLLFSRGGIDIATLIKPSFVSGVKVSKKQFKLNKQEIKKIQKNAKASLTSNVIRFYKVTKESRIEGYAVLLLQTVRTKKTAVLYIIDKKEKIKSIEIVAFNEPKEYKPNPNWLDEFHNKSKDDNLFFGKGISTISGATMSARAVSDLARIALAIVQRYK